MLRPLGRGCDEGLRLLSPVLGIATLIGFAAMLTRADTAFAGRAYAAYGGIYIAASLIWLWAVEGQRPEAPDLIGAGIAIVGSLVIVGFAARQP